MNVEVIDPLTDDERAELAECEQVIGHGIRSFVDLGHALGRVMEGRLYRETHATFKAYVEQRWSMSRIHAYRTLHAAEVVGVLPIGNTPPESVARELVPLLLKDGSTRVTEAWGSAVEQHGPKPTAKQVQQIVRELRPAATGDGRKSRRENTTTRRLIEGTAGTVAALGEQLSGFDLEPALDTFTDAEREHLISQLTTGIQALHRLRRMLGKGVR